MPVDNTIYDRMADTWWDDNGVLHLLRTAMNPARFGYFHGVMAHRPRAWAPATRALDVGCGGGLLAEEFARIGCRVTGIDPSAPSIDAARTHAAGAGLDIRYCVASGEALPFDDGCFEIVYACDVLEHVRDLEAVIGEIARVLAPGGLYLYDTINRTAQSKFLMIKLLQEWEWSRLLPPDLHDWNMFIRPEELHAVMSQHGLENRETVGTRSRSTPTELLRALRRFKRGEIGLGELGRRIALAPGSDTSVSYMGYGAKQAKGVIGGHPRSANEDAE